MQQETDTDIVLSSTTSSQAELDHAASDNWREPFVAPADGEQAEGDATEGEAGDGGEESSEVAAATKSGPESETGEGEEHEEQAGTTRRRGKGVQGRIDQLTREKFEAQKRAEELERQLEAARREPVDDEEEADEEEVPQASAKKPEAAPKPKPEDFESFEAFTEALASWAAKNTFDELTKKQRQEAAQNAQNAELKARYDAHLSRVQEFSRQTPDFNEAATALQKGTAIKESAALAVIELDNGPAVLYHLAKNPAKLKELNAMSDVRAVAEIGALSAELRKPATPAPRTPQAKPVSKAPAPIKPVSGATTRSSVPMDKLDPDEYIAVREKQIQARRGR